MTHPWPWFVAGPVIGLFVPALLIVDSKLFGVSSNLRHVCAAIFPARLEYFRYDWKTGGLWNLLFAAGMVIGGWLAVHGAADQTVAISQETTLALSKLGIHDFLGVAPRELFSWSSLLTFKGFVLIVVGGLLVGFGTAWAGGCTSGHAIAGLADFQPASLLAVIGFFAGGLFATYFLLPLVL